MTKIIFENSIISQANTNMSMLKHVLIDKHKYEIRCNLKHWDTRSSPF